MDELSQKLQTLLSDPQSMQQLSELARMIGLPSSPTPSESDLQSAEAEQITGIINLIKEAKTDDENICFLNALKPLLDEERQPRVDKAIKMLRLINLMPSLRDSGLLGGDLFGIF